MSKLINVFILYAAAVFSGCTPNTNKDLVTHCDNTFVVSDNDDIYLFEHENDSVKFHLLKKFENRSNNAAFYNCQRNIIVSPYGYKGLNHRTGGVTIFDLNNGNKKDYDISDGVNSQVGLYKNGVLLSTKRIHLSQIDENLGYVPPRTIIKESVLETPESFPEELVSDYKKGKYWKTFEYTHLFDLDTYQVTQSYKQSLFYDAQIFKGKAYSQLAINSFGILDLESGFREKIFESTRVKKKDGSYLTMPANAIYILVEDNYYILTTHRLWDFSNHRGERGVRQFKKNTLYKVDNEQALEVVTLPFNKMGYAFSIDKDILFFSQNARSVAKFNTQTKKVIQYKLALPKEVEGKYIESVGYTKNNFIFSLSSRDGYSKGVIFLTNKNFTEISPVYEVNMGDMSITTNESI